MSTRADSPTFGQNKSIASGESQYDCTNSFSEVRTSGPFGGLLSKDGGGGAAWPSSGLEGVGGGSKDLSNSHFLTRSSEIKSAVPLSLLILGSIKRNNMPRLKTSFHQITLVGGFLTSVFGAQQYIAVNRLFLFLKRS